MADVGDLDPFSPIRKALASNAGEEVREELRVRQRYFVCSLQFERPMLSECSGQFSSRNGFNGFHTGLSSTAGSERTLIELSSLCGFNGSMASIDL